jgi:hypothetical protein
MARVVLTTRWSLLNLDGPVILKMKKDYSDR